MRNQVEYLAYQKSYRERHRDEKNAYAREWRKADPERSKRSKANWHEVRADWLMVYKQSRGCAECGYDKSSAALELHHRDPAEKLYDANGMSNLSKVAMLVEIDKCDILCANCHRELHGRAI